MGNQQAKKKDQKSKTGSKINPKISSKVGSKDVPSIQTIKTHYEAVSQSPSERVKLQLISTKQSKSVKSLFVSSKSSSPSTYHCLSSSMKIRRGPDENPFFKVSSPSILGPNDMTAIYNLPEDNLQTKEDVLAQRNYKLEKQIGKGAYSVVYKGKNQSTGKDIACKIITFVNDQNIDHRIADMKNELFVLERNHHPYIMTLYEHFIIDNQLYIIMKYADNGSLTKILKFKGPMSEKYCKKPFAQIVCGLQHMHNKGICHRDLKCDNILFDAKINAIITDFGLSRVGYRESKGGIQMASNYCGTEPYMAPEILKKNRYYNPFPSDIWALGVILFVMYNRTHPFDPSDKNKMLDNQLKQNYQFSKRVPDPSIMLINIIQCMLHPNPDKRITIDQLKGHKWYEKEIKKINNYIQNHYDQLI